MAPPRQLPGKGEPPRSCVSIVLWYRLPVLINNNIMSRKGYKLKEKDGQRGLTTAS